MKKAAFYGRYSSANQTEQSIEGQLHVCEQYAEQSGIEIVAHYIDRAKSGKTDNRPQFQQMISDSERKKFDVVLVYKLDRFARNRYDSAIYKRKLKQHGISVVSATEPLTDTPEGIIMEALLEGMDEYYSAELARKMHRGKTESFNKGLFINRLAPFGYRVENHRLVLDETKAPLAAEMFRRYASGERFADIIRWLDGLGIPNGNGRNWQNWNLSVILKNRVYIGEYTRQDMEGVSSCPALVDVQTFELVQKRLAEFAHKARENKMKAFDYFLSGSLICGECGRHIGGSSTKQYHYYRCGTCKPTAYCKAEQLHERVIGALREYLTDEKLDELAAGAYEAYRKETSSADVRPAVEKELADVEKQLRNAVNAILNGVDALTLKDTMAGLERRKSELQAVLDDAGTPPPKLEYEHFRMMLQIIIEKAQTDDMRQLIHTVVNQIVLKDGTAFIFINLTDETQEPPIERFSVEVDTYPFQHNSIPQLAGNSYHQNHQRCVLKPV